MQALIHAHEKKWEQKLLTLLDPQDADVQREAVEQAFEKVKHGRGRRMVRWGLMAGMVGGLAGWFFLPDPWFFLAAMLMVASCFMRVVMGLQWVDHENEHDNEVYDLSPVKPSHQTMMEALQRLTLLQQNTISSEARQAVSVFFNKDPQKVCLRDWLALNNRHLKKTIF